MITVELKIPPSVNQIYRRASWGGMYMTKEGKGWKNHAAWEIKRLAKRARYKRAEVDMKVFVKGKRKLDIDNLCKLCGDSIKESGLIQDDSWDILYKWTIEALPNEEEKIIVTIKEG